MNYLRFSGALLFCLLLVSACNEPTSSASSSTATSSAKNPTPLTSGEMTVVDTARYQPLYVHPLLAEVELNAPNTAIGNFGKVLPQPMDRMEAQLLTQSYWVMEFWHDGHASAQQRLNGQGQWFKFNPDGTFIGGHWNRQTHAGAWYILFDRDDVYLTLDSNVDRLDAKWHIQAISNDRTEMGWVRTPDFGPRTPRAIQAKMITLDNVPTKEQFHVQ